MSTTNIMSSVILLTVLSATVCASSSTERLSCHCQNMPYCGDSESVTCPDSSYSCFSESKKQSKIGRMEADPNREVAILKGCASDPRKCDDISIQVKEGLAYGGCCDTQFCNAAPRTVLSAILSIVCASSFSNH